MKSYINEIIKKDLSRVENINLIREYLQKYILFLLYKNKFYTDIVFTGGTALRFFFRLKRFSEDLDFSLSKKAKDYNFKKILEILKKELILAGYKVEIKYSEDKNVNSAFIKFLDLLYEMGISNDKNEKFSIKLEIDIKPPGGGKEVIDMHNSVFMFEVKHFDISSLFAGKLHAILCRKFNKGRDYYDLIWYLTKFKDLEPNIDMLKNAILQTCSNKVDLNKFNWKKELIKKIAKVDFKELKKDIVNLLELKDEVNILHKENLINLLK